LVALTAQEARYVAGVRNFDFDRGLAPYATSDAADHERWCAAGDMRSFPQRARLARSIRPLVQRRRKLTSHMRPAVLEQCGLQLGDTLSPGDADGVDSARLGTHCTAHRS
jgi:hypothetical protein